MRFLNSLAVALVMAVLVACGGSFHRAGEHAARAEWTQAIVEYRKAVAEDPDDISYRQQLRRAEENAANYYLDRGKAQAAAGKHDAALAEFQLGLSAVPDHTRLQQLMGESMVRKEAESLYAEAHSYMEARRPADARRQLERALEVDPEFESARKLLAYINAEEQKFEQEKLVLSSRKPVTLNFRQTDIRAAYDFLARSFGINVAFDEAIKPTPVTLFVKDATFEQALQLLSTTSKTFNKQIGASTLLIIPDAKDKRSQYDEHMVRTFYLNNIKAKESAEVLKNVLGIRKMSINEASNTIVLRDSKDVVSQAEKLLDSIDRRPAEVMLDVEILEINRNKAEQLGLDFGREIGVKFPTFAVTDAPQAALETALRGGTVTLPATTLRYFKQDVDAKVLANPKVRTLNNKQAKVHIGDRVPLRAATIVDVTGQTRTTYDYRDIGVKLTVEPSIHLDHSTTVKVMLEVSSLGTNVGTAAEPALTIGTRNAEAFMTLRDGETAILGGLIRDEERKNRIKLPGAGDVPLIGNLFTSFDDEKKRTDVLLTITPRVVRGWQIPARSTLAFYSGTEQAYSNTPVVTTGAGPLQVASAAGVVIGGGGVPAAASDAVPTAPAPGIAPGTGTDTGTPAPAPAGATPAIGFSQGVYQMTAGQETEFRLTGNVLTGSVGAVFELNYNPQIFSFVLGSSNVGGTVTSPQNGVIRVELAYGAAPPDNSQLASFVLRALQPATVYLSPLGPYLNRADGTRVAASSRAARVSIQ